MKKITAPLFSALLLAMLLLMGCGSFSGDLGDSMRRLWGGEMSQETLIAGLKEALSVGTENTVARTSKKGGYLNNALIRIPLPEKMEKMGSALRTIGLGEQVDRFELQMNEAAEMAAKSAAPIFGKAIREITFEDAKSILKGGDTAVTDYFREKTSTALAEQYRPIVSEQMGKLGVVKLYQDLEKHSRLFAPKASFSVEDYVSGQALKGLFTTLAGEETKIRQDPAARTTALLREVFGQKNNGQ